MGAGRGGDYCDTEVFRAECSEGQLIMLERAVYGRMRLGRCIEIDLGYIGCQRDVTDIVDRRCSGLPVCEMRIPDAELESTRACLKELKTYLHVSYRCITREWLHAITHDIASYIHGVPTNSWQELCQILTDLNCFHPETQQ